MPSLPKPYCFPLSQQQPGSAKTEPQSAEHPSECFPTSSGAAIPAATEMGSRLGMLLVRPVPPWAVRLPLQQPNPQGPGQHTGHSSCRAWPMAGLVASLMLTRYSVSGGQDVVTVHVYTCTIKSKRWCEAKLGQKPHLLTEEIFFSQR